MLIWILILFSFFLLSVLGWHLLIDYVGFKHTFPWYLIFILQYVPTSQSQIIFHHQMLTLFTLYYSPFAFPLATTILLSVCVYQVLFVCFSCLFPIFLLVYIISILFKIYYEHIVPLHNRQWLPLFYGQFLEAPCFI